MPYTSQPGCGGAMSCPIPVTLLAGVPPAPFVRLVEQLISAPSPRNMMIISDMRVGQSPVTLSYWSGDAWRTLFEADRAAALRRYLEIASGTERVILNTADMDHTALQDLLKSDPQLAAAYALHETVAVLDVSALQSPLAADARAVALIGQADKVLLTSLRPMSRKRRDSLLSHIQRLNAHAPILEACGADIQFAELLNPGPLLV